MTTTNDSHGNPISGSSESVALYDRAIDRLVRYHPDVVELATALYESDDRAPMGSALMAYLNLMSTDAADLDAARQAAARMRSAQLNAREQAHAAAIDAWLEGNWTGASTALDGLLVQWPTDVLALLIGHQLDFFLGDATNLRDRPLRSLAEFAGDDPHGGFVRGMASFGLEESGHYGHALDAGLAAVEEHPDDVWGIHAVVHTYEMQGKVEEGIDFLSSDSTHWESGNMFTVHNWWHLALYNLEAGRTREALEIYDAEVHHAGSAGVPIEMLDASALLWRLHLDGIDTGDRFATLAEAWAQKNGLDPWYSFNDLHAVMAFIGAGRRADAVALVAARQHWLAQPHHPDETNVTMSATIGVPAARAVIALADGRAGEAVELLLPIRRRFHHFGGSHAQRDALQRTLLEAAIRDGQLQLARRLLAERLALRESSLYGWTQSARVLAAMDQPAAAEQARQRADQLRARLAHR